MSTFDLNSTIELLRSSKIKTRNDALSSLQKAPYHKLAHNPKHLLALSQALLRAIEIERGATLTDAVASRVANASLLLRELVEASLALPASKRPKYKAFYTLVSTMQTLFFDASGEASSKACSAHFAHILDILLKSEPFFIHLSIESWSKTFKFVTRAITVEFDSHSPNDVLLKDLFSALASLLGSSSSVLCPLVQSRTYFCLLHILKKAVEMYTKRENPIIVSTFQIINKLLVALSTEDLHFLHEVIHLGVIIILQFNSTALDQLFFQFLWFLNHDSFYRYFDVSKYPKLVTSDSSADSPTSSGKSEDSRALYTLSTLLQALLQRSQNVSLKLSPEDVGSYSSRQSSGYYNLRTIYHRCDNTQPWLLLRALSRLISLYYMTEKEMTDGSFAPERFSSWAEGASVNKRQKIKDFKERFATCSSDLHFLASLLDEQDSRLRTVGLQLLLFHFEWSPSRLLHSFVLNTDSGDAPQLRPKPSTTLLSFQDEESLMSEILTKLLSFTTDKNLGFWCLATFRSLHSCVQTSAVSFRPFFVERLHQLLKLLVPIVKDKNLYHVACMLFTDVVSAQNTVGLQKLFDSNMLSQLHSILDLSDIAGPALLSDSGLTFWESLASVFKNISSPSGDSLPKSVSRWIIGKWDATFGNISPRQQLPISAERIAQSILWIGGIEASFPCENGDTKNELRNFANCKTSLKLQEFISFEPIQKTITASKYLKPIKLTGSDQSVERIIEKMCEISKERSDEETNYSNPLACAIFMMQVANLITNKYKDFAGELENSSRNLAGSLAPSIDSKNAAALAILTILSNKPSPRILGDIYFPFELIDYHFRFSGSASDKISGLKRTNVLDGEFSQSPEPNQVKIDSSQLVQVSPVEYFEFLFLYQSRPLGELARVIDGMSPKDMLACFGILVKFLEESSPDQAKSSLADVVRLLGEGPLSSHEHDRSEITIDLACRLVNKIFSFMATGSLEMTTYCSDLISFFLQCLRKSLFLTDTVLVKTWILCLEYTRYNNEEIVSNADIRSLFLQSFASFTNSMKLQLSGVINEFIAAKDLSTQLLFLQEINSHFLTPQSSIESSATYCYFMALLTKNTDICPQVLHILLDYSVFASFMPYLIQGIKIVAEIQKQENSRALFKRTNVDLIKSWLVSGFSLWKFPFRAFEYSDLQSFLLDNCRYIAAITNSLETSALDVVQKKAIIDNLAELKSCDGPDLIQDSLPLVIGLAYTNRGSRNKVFQMLSDYLQELYKPLMKENLLLTILTIAKLTDVRNGAALGAALNNKSAERMFTTKKVINSSSISSISPSSSVDLTSALISKYCQETGFWSVQTVYFLFRQLSLDLDEADALQKVAIIRRIQFFWNLSNIGFHDHHLVDLVMELLCPFIGEGFDEDIFFLLNQMDLTCFKSMPVENALPSAIVYLSRCVEKDFSGMFLDFHLAFESSLPAMHGVLNRVISFLFQLKKPDGERSLNFTDVKAFLAQECMQKCIRRFYDSWVSVVSELFSHTYTPHKSFPVESNPTPKLVELFLAHHVAPHKQNPHFSLWVSEYLADYYLSGRSFISDDMQSDLFKDRMSDNLKSISDDFGSAHSTVNSFLKALIVFYEQGDNKQKAFLESVFGVFLWNSSDESSRYVDLPEFAELFSSYIVPMSSVSCDYLIQEAASKSQIIGSEQSVDTFFQKECVFLLSLAQQIPYFSNMTSIIKSCVLHSPEIGVKILPSFILFYLYMVPNSTETILRYISEDPRHEHCEKKTELMTCVILSIRVGAKRNIRPFKDLYSSLDHSSIFSMARESESSESALMLFEDYADYQPENFQLEHYRKPLTEIYSALDEFDLISEISMDSSFDNPYKTLKSEELPSESIKYESAFMDASMALGERFEGRQMVRSLLGSGMLGLSKVLGEAADGSGLRTSSEWSWKLSQWDTPADDESIEKHDVIYSYFKQLQESPLDEIKSHAASLYDTMMTKILNERTDFLSKHVNVKNRKQQMQVWLETLAILRSANVILTSDAGAFVTGATEFEKSTTWFEEGDTSRCEDVILARKLAFELRGRFSASKPSSELRSICLMGQANELSRYNGLFKSDGNHQKAINSSVLLDRLTKSEVCNNSAQLMQFSLYQTAQTLWTSGEASIPISVLKKLEEAGNISLPFPRLSVHSSLIKAQLAKWKAESRMDLGINILEQIVHPMESTIAEIEITSQRAQVYDLLARFCEQQYKSSVLKEQIRELTNRVQDRKQEIEDIKSYYSKNSVTSSEKKAVQKYYNRLKNQSIAEADELERAKDTKARFIATSIKFYLEAILIDEKDEHVDKFFSIFFELSSNDKLQESLHDSLCQLNSYKPVSWCSQILSRVSKESSAFQKNLRELVMKICLDHPYHALYPLISLIFNEKLASDTSNLEMLARVGAAKDLRDSLLSSSAEYASEILAPIEKLCQECVSLAEVKSSRGKPLHLDKLKIGDYFMNHLPKLPPPTLELEVSRTGYSHVPKMVKIEKEVSIAASGLSLPKIAKLYLSDGCRHKMLLKHGADDLRQDAIMEQVFEKVNRIFVKDKETRKRHLIIRTYRAVPLGPRAGVIEFVPNSKALIEVIRPYHTKMDKMKVEKARELMKKNQSADMNQRVKVYRTIESAIKPVLRHYFAQNFLTPDAWFHSRQLYTRGVATTSMVGHILGLGDRHCNNILLDEFTGEPIHIDLGVAFDQGKRLPIPELVPFRLTRDIVDGFGSLGVNGSFSRLSEHTFRVLRSNQEQILGILDVLRWDPLYSWSISPIRKRKLQEENPLIEPEVRRDASEAESAILMVTEKLHARGLSVEATVRDLIREATSEHNLAMIYCGWYPFY